MDRDQLYQTLEELRAKDPDAFDAIVDDLKATDDYSPGKRGARPRRTPATLEAVFRAVTRERFKEKHRKNGKYLSVSKACEILAKRGERHRKPGSGGIRIKYPDGYVEHLNNQDTIRDWYNDAVRALKDGDEYLNEVLRGWVQNYQMRSYLHQLKIYDIKIRLLEKLEQLLGKGKEKSGS